MNEQKHKIFNKVNIFNFLVIILIFIADRFSKIKIINLVLSDNKSVYIKDEVGLEKYIINNSQSLKKMNKKSKEFANILNEEKSKLSIQRFKGLGEMNPVELWNTTLNPETRNLLQVEYSKNIKIDQKYILSLLSGKSFDDENFIKNTKSGYSL